jgi:hypothetical protein
MGLVGVAVHPEALGQRQAFRFVAEHIGGEAAHSCNEVLGPHRAARRRGRIGAGDRLGAQFYAVEEALGSARGLQDLLALSHTPDLREGVELADVNP